MFTWEEAGQLRSMLTVIKWTVIVVMLGLLVLEHEPLGAVLTAGFHTIENAIASVKPLERAPDPAGR